MAARRKEVVRLPHHDQMELCTTRAKYRQGRKLTAVKVYSVNEESQHLLVCGVPSLGLQDDLQRLCKKFGDIKSLVFVPEYAEEEFTDAFHVQYSRIQSARYAKRALDGREFFGGILQVCYMPEMESVSETRAKLIQRRKDVAKRTRKIAADNDSKTGNVDNVVQYKPRKPFVSQDNMNCIWKGTPCTVDPRTITPAEELIKASSVYGPQMPDKEYWAQAGVRERRFINNKNLQSKSKTDIFTNQPSTSTKPASALRFIPRQVASTKRIVFQSKTDDKTQSEQNDDKAQEETNSKKRKAESSLEGTVKDIREKIRAVSVPNIQIVLDRGDPFTR